MNLIKMIVHELKKDSGNSNTSVINSNIVVPINQESIELINALLQSYTIDNLLNGQFDSGPGKYFPLRFNGYTESDRNDDDFISFTIDVLGNLETIIKQKIAAKGGYLVFAEYDLNGKNFVAVFLIRDTQGKIIERTGNSFTIGRIEYLDTNHLAMACRINENLIGTGQNYLTFTRLRQPEVSDYFTDWISVLQLQSSAEFTKALYEIINKLDLPINPETQAEYSLDEVRNMVYETARNNARKEINIQALSEQIYGNPELIRNYAEENQIIIDTEFRYDKRILNNFIQLHVNKDGINLKISRGDLGTKVKISEESPEDTIIIESQSFVEALREQINGE